MERMSHQEKFSEQKDFSKYESPSYLRAILEKGEYVSSEDAKALRETFENNFSVYGVVPGDLRMELLGVEKGDIKKISSSKATQLKRFIESRLERKEGTN